MISVCDLWIPYYVHTRHVVVIWICLDVDKDGFLFINSFVELERIETINIKC